MLVCLLDDAAWQKSPTFWNLVGNGDVFCSFILLHNVYFDVCVCNESHSYDLLNFRVIGDLRDLYEDSKGNIKQEMFDHLLALHGARNIIGKTLAVS